MSDGKRVTLTTISNTVSSSLLTTGLSSSATLRFGADFLAPPDKSMPSTTVVGGGGKCANKTLRLKVELFQTDSNKYPEFDYAKLLHLEKKKIKKLNKKTNGFLDPFEENDDDVARIAKELERKYGSAYTSGRGKNKRDDVDIGLGYDESDSFIDNTEAYDELIPDEVETIEGGFYINCGALEFKKLNPESLTTKTDEIIKMPNRPKKRVISSSSEESTSDDDDDDDGEDDDDDDDDDSDDEDGDGEDGTGEETSVETIKSKSSSVTTALGSKRAKISQIKVSPGGLNKNKSSENGNSSTKNKSSSGLLAGGSSSNSPKPTTDELATDSERERSVKKITSVKEMLKAQRDNYLKSRNNEVKSSNGDNNKEKSSGDDDDDDVDDESSSSDDSDDDDDDDGNSAGNSDSNQGEIKIQKDKKTLSSNEENQGNEKLRSTDTKLPDLEADVLTSVLEFREGAKQKNLIGKKFQFDDQLSESFLKIDDLLLCIDKSERNMVFAHFEYHLSLPKYYFLRKAKQLRIKEEKLKSKRAFNKLHKAVTETMPAVIASYDAELKRYNDYQANRSTNASSEQTPKMPKKKFPWNTYFRNLLYDVYQVRWTSYPVLGTRKETLEEFITSFMSKKVVEIWPKGWMRYEELQKEIEKRKTAAKKAKEKGKTVSQNSLNLPTATNKTPHNNNQNFSTMQLNKQMEDLTAVRSNENSETDSIASNSTSSGLKRKNIEVSGCKQSKFKAAKINGEQKKPSSLLSSYMVTSPSKKSDHSINHIISPTSEATSASAATTHSSSIFSSNASALSQPNKHSTKTHIIDLDYYTNASDILQTTKQIQQAAAAAASSNTITTQTPQFALSNVNPLTSNKTAVRRESSGDSEIEIVGVFPAKAPTKKQKTNSRSATPNSNLNSHNNNKSSKKSISLTASGGGAINVMGIDVNKNDNNCIDLRGEDIQVKQIPNIVNSSLSSQQTSTLVSTLSSSTVPSTQQ